MTVQRITTSVLGYAVEYLKERLNCNAVGLEVISTENDMIKVPETAFRSNLPIKSDSRIILRVTLNHETSHPDIKVLQELTSNMRERKDFIFDRDNNQIIFKTRNAVKLLEEQAKSYITDGKLFSEENQKGTDKH